MSVIGPACVTMLDNKTDHISIFARLVLLLFYSPICLFLLFINTHEGQLTNNSHSKKICYSSASHFFKNIVSWNKLSGRM